MDKIKLVIWDLDETFWRGTLSEEGIVISDENIRILKQLTDRGIINSIASKNDFEQAKEVLIKNGIWDYFVFPSIEWKPKGLLIKDIIEQCQLRDVNTLFIDDNHLNLEEAKFYNPQLHTELPEFIPQILTHPAFEGKDDSNHSRLEQYKQLEKKAVVAKTFTDNKQFLESSDIQLQYVQGKDLLVNIDRIVELLERTNQLNYTKNRWGRAEVEALLENPVYDSRLIRVKDKFGDYGLVGFYSLHEQDNRLTHFTFSCRILNLHIPQYIYSKLGFPKLTIVPDVVEELTTDAPTWIKEMKPASTNHTAKTKKQQKKIFFKGGCDLSQMLFYLQGLNVEVTEETNYQGENNFPIHQEHTQTIVDARNLKREDRDYIQNSEYIAFTDAKYYHSDIFNFDYDCLIYSALMDYTQEMYQHKEKNILLPFGGYFNLWSDESCDNDLIDLYTDRNIPFSKDYLIEFRKNFTHLGQISPEAFKKNLHTIREFTPKSIPIVFINGVELKSPHVKEGTALIRHRDMNKALDEFIAESENTFLVDVRKIVTEESRLTNNIRHYDRESYQKIAAALIVLLKEILGKDVKIVKKPIIERLVGKGKSLIRRSINKINAVHIRGV